MVIYVFFSFSFSVSIFNIIGIDIENRIANKDSNKSTKYGGPLKSKKLLIFFAFGGIYERKLVLWPSKEILTPHYFSPYITSGSFASEFLHFSTFPTHHLTPIAHTIPIKSKEESVGRKVPFYTK